MQDSRIAAAVVVTFVLHSAAVLFTSPPRRHAHRTNAHSLGRGIRLLAGCGHECRRREELPREGRVVVLRTQSVRDHDGCGGISGRVRHPQNSSFLKGAPDARRQGLLSFLFPIPPARGLWPPEGTPFLWPARGPEPRTSMVCELSRDL